MTAFLIFLIICLIVAVIYWIYRGINDGRKTINDDMFSQAGVTIIYKEGTIKIKNYTYPVDKVTRLRFVPAAYGRRDSTKIQFEVDDMEKPVHNIIIVGTEKRAEEFYNRLGVAIRKAGGKGFN